MVYAVLLVHSAFFIGLVTYFGGFGLGGFEVEEILSKFTFYIGPAAIALLGIGGLVFLESKFLKGSGYESIIIHKPSVGVLGSFFRSYGVLVWGSLLLFGFLGILATSTQTAFMGIPVYEQQFTPSASVIFSVYPASTSEGLTWLFTVLLSSFGLGLLFKRFGGPAELFRILRYPLILVVSVFYGVSLHLLRYGASDIAILNVGLFWFLTGLLYILFASWVPSFLLHDVNNLFVRLNQLFSSDVVLFSTVGILLLLLVFGVLAWLIFRERGG